MQKNASRRNHPALRQKYAAARGCLLAALSVVVTFANPSPANDVASAWRDFEAPPIEARPACFYHWIDGNVSLDGITADLEALHRAGVGRVVLFQAGFDLPNGPVQFGSPEWLAAMRHLGATAKRLGIEVIFTAGPGWKAPGGPWVPPEDGFQTLVWREVNASGPGETRVPLPTRADGSYRDVALYLLPAPAAGAQTVEIPKLGQIGFHSEPQKFEARPLVEAAAVRQITGAPGPDNTLEVDLPPGEWRVLRVGHRFSGDLIGPVSESNRGPAVDGLKPEALQRHWDRAVQPMYEALGSAAHAVLVDSWELRTPNWTPAFAERFRAARGYDPLPWLPVLTGQVVGNVQDSERFLWDVRRTVAEEFTRGSMRQLRELAHARGLKFFLEPHHSGVGLQNVPFDNLEIAREADTSMCEFWQDWGLPHASWRVAWTVSARNLWGRRVADAEAFTSGHQYSPWNNLPGQNKRLGDQIFAEGINRMTMHSYVHQPFAAAPGVTLRQYGQIWSRHTPWFEAGAAWMQYFARTQAVLQSGLPVSDVLLFIREDVPTPLPSTPLPPGFKMDRFNTAVLRERLRGQDGWAITPDGLRYGLVIVPDLPQITPETATELVRLAREGASLLLGKAPTGSPSLSGQPAADERVRALVAELWGDASTPNDRAFGAGRVLRGMSATDALRRLGRQPRVTVDAKLPVRWTQRRLDDADVFFVANDSDKPLRFSAGFASQHADVELWNALDRSARRPLAAPKAEGTKPRSLELSLPAQGAVFVVFRSQARDLPAATDATVPPRVVKAVEQPWTLTLDGLGAPKEPIAWERLRSLSEAEDSAVKHFAGRATFTTEVELDAAALQAPLHLDLGAVEGVAEVRINDQPAGTLWCVPFQTGDLRPHLRAGKNKLAVTVSTAWHNRLIGDASLPDYPRVKVGKSGGVFAVKAWPDWVKQGLARSNEPNARSTFVAFQVARDMAADVPLRPSGLLGPVRLVTP